MLAISQPARCWPNQSAQGLLGHRCHKKKLMTKTRVVVKKLRLLHSSTLPEDQGLPNLICEIELHCCFAALSRLYRP